MGSLATLNILNPESAIAQKADQSSKGHLPLSMLNSASVKIGGVWDLEAIVSK